MTPPRAAFDARLRSLEDAVLELGSMVDLAVADSIKALLERDVERAKRVVDSDRNVNRLRFEIDEMSMSVLALEAPVASDLRLIVAALAVVQELERMGDHAAGIARIVVMMADEPLAKPLIDIPVMAELARGMLRASLDALVERDEGSAVAVGDADDEVDRLYEQVYAELLRFMIDDPGLVRSCTYLLWVAHNLERIADRATNIAERAVFTATGAQPRMNVSSY